MSKFKRVMQQNRRAAFVLGITPDEYFLQVALPKAEAKWRKRGYKLVRTPVE